MFYRDSELRADGIIIVEMGFGGCMLGNIQKAQLREILNVPADYEILLAVALGKPKETVMIDEIDQDGDIKYWRDQNQVHRCA